MLTVPLDQVTFVSLDVETTGLDPRRDAIVEIGAVKIVGNRVVDEFDTLVYIDKTIPFEARRIHGINNEMLVGSPRTAEALRLFFDFAGEAALVEHSYKAFDVLFLEQAWGKRIGTPYVNTCMLSRRLFPHMPRHNLDACCRRFGIVNRERAERGRHRALADALATGELLLKLLQLCAPRYPRLGDLVNACSIQR
ncbi:MAG TPA: 3'-5' exonuclease [Chloroflexota bacterium]|nr:3'-5' exonuclease [Chloroflexota bacterium]